MRFEAIDGDDDEAEDDVWWRWRWSVLDIVIIVIMEKCNIMELYELSSSNMLLQFAQSYCSWHIVIGIAVLFFVVSKNSVDLLLLDMTKFN